MSRIGKKFEALRGEGALIAYITAGDPDLETTQDLVLVMEEAGVDVVELGIPFSDPLADGPSIQAASQRALAGGTTPAGVLETVGRIRERSRIPIVLMTYFNPVHRYGPARFAEDASGAGADGVLITDLPPEEAGEWKALAGEHGLDTIFLLAPTSTPERIALVGRIGTGFVYCVSRTGVTGKRTELSESIRALVRQVREHTRSPIAVGFGISRPEDVREVVSWADGAIVGSAFVEIIARDGRESLRAVGEFARELKAATHRHR